MWTHQINEQPVGQNNIRRAVALFSEPLLFRSKRYVRYDELVIYGKTFSSAYAHRCVRTSSDLSVTCACNNKKLCRSAGATPTLTSVLG